MKMEIAIMVILMSRICLISITAASKREQASREQNEEGNSSV